MKSKMSDLLKLLGDDWELLPTDENGSQSQILPVRNKKNSKLRAIIKVFNNKTAFIKERNVLEAMRGHQGFP